METDRQLVAAVLEQLLDLRAAKGKLTPQKLSQYPVLIDLLGADDLLDAFMAFRRELRRYIQTANRDEAAAALSIYADAENVLDRLEYTANRLSESDKPKDQRTARRWSNDGMPLLAEDLVYMAKVRRRLGNEMLSIELHPAPDDSLLVIVDQIVQADLDVEAPEVTLWAMSTDGDPQRISLDLAEVPATSTVDGEHRLVRQRLLLDHALIQQVTPEKGLTLVVASRDAPMRTISFENRWTPPEGIEVRLSAYRMRAGVELSRDTRHRVTDL